MNESPLKQDMQSSYQNMHKAETLASLSPVKTIAIQGFEGSFHQQAARQYFGDHAEVICCHNFRDALNTASDNNNCDGAIMAIENSIAGSILSNYNLLRKSNLHIAGEVYLHIRQNLLVNRGVALEDIHEVHSHPMALQQCLKFLDNYSWKLVEAEDTALSAKSIHQHKSKHIAAIASTLAAEIYDLEILRPDIHTIYHNYTRFFVLQRPEATVIPEGANKATITFYAKDFASSLAKILTKIENYGIELSKLQSFPIPEVTWKYMFGVDLEFGTIEQFYEMMESIKPMTGETRIYGIYKKGATVTV